MEIKLKNGNLIILNFMNIYILLFWIISFLIHKYLNANFYIYLYMNGFYFMLLLSNILIDSTNIKTWKKLK